MTKEVLKLAEIIRVKREMQLVSGAWGLNDPLLAKKTLYAYIQELVQKKAKTDLMRCVLPHLRSFPGGENIRLDQITNKWFLNFQEYLESDCNLAKRSAQLYSNCMRQALRHAVHEGILQSNPADGIKAISAPDTTKVHLTLVEIEAIATATTTTDLQDEIKRAFLFGCVTGLRISDIKSLLWSNIEGDQIVKSQKKTNNVVYIPLNASAIALIQDDTQPGVDDPVFPLLYEESTPKLIRQLKLLAKKADITKNIGWHTARHTFAVLELENGVDIYTVSKLLGHTNLQTTQVYARATSKMKRDAVNALPTILIK
jgi:site-specific recombinase XerD